MLGLDTVYRFIKFDDSSFSGSRDTVGAHKNFNGSRDQTMPLAGINNDSWLALATINLPTKFEASISTQYEDMKGDTKYRKLAGWFSVVSGHSRSLKKRHSIEGIRFLISVL